MLIDFLDWLEPYYDCTILTDTAKADASRKSGSRVNVHNDMKNQVSKDSSQDYKTCQFCRNSGHQLQCTKFEKNIVP